jgi:GMP reductase
MQHKQLKYEDICLIPNYSEAYSRVDCDTSCELEGRTFKLPIMPANMKSVIDMRIAKWMSENDYFYIMHRFENSLREVVAQMNDENWNTVSASMGVQMKDKKDVVAISKKKHRVDFITIDIAHGHCERMKIAIECVKKFLPNTKIIAGNVATSAAVKDLAKWGADIVKVGIGQGSPCTTKDKTGFTLPMFSCTLDCAGQFASSFETQAHDLLDKQKPIPIIADGGVKCNGDIAKAIVAGADMVMAGGMFAACTDSPAASSTINDVPHKAYFGSASAENKGHANNIEGKLTNICASNMTYEEKLNEIKQDVQSSISYAGGGDLRALKHVEHRRVT